MKISIITPTFNSQKFIRETIESIKNQTYSNYEHIIIDGKSDDGTLEILNDYPELKIISERDTGQSNALNKGFKIAKGDIFAWQNSDDLYAQTAFEKVINFFYDNPSIDFVYGYYKLISEKSEFICNVRPPEWKDWRFKYGRFVPMQPTVFWRRQAHNIIGSLNEDLHYCMDVDYFARGMIKGLRFKLLKEFLGMFRVHDQSKTQSNKNNELIRQEYYRVLSNHFDYGTFSSFLFGIFSIRSFFGKSLKRRVAQFSNKIRIDS